jgi:hypothetical protein
MNFKIRIIVTAVQFSGWFDFKTGAETALYLPEYLQNIMLFLKAEKAKLQNACFFKTVYSFDLPIGLTDITAQPALRITLSVVEPTNIDSIRL